MLTPNPPDMALALLSLDLVAHRLDLLAEHNSATAEEALVDPGLAAGEAAQRGVVARPYRHEPALQRVVARPNQRRAVQPQHVARPQPADPERQRDFVSCCDQERLRVDVDRDVVWWLGGEKREEGRYGGIGLGVDGVRYGCQWERAALWKLKRF